MEKSYNCDVLQCLSVFAALSGKIAFNIYQFWKRVNHTSNNDQLKWVTFSISVSCSHFSAVLFYITMKCIIAHVNEHWPLLSHWNYKHLRKLLCIKSEKSVIKSSTHAFTILFHIQYRFRKFYYPRCICVHIYTYTWQQFIGKNCEKWPTLVQMLCSLILHKWRAKQTSKRKKEQENANKMKHVRLHSHKQKRARSHISTVSFALYQQ